MILFLNNTHSFCWSKGYTKKVSGRNKSSSQTRTKQVCFAIYKPRLFCIFFFFVVHCFIFLYSHINQTLKCKYRSHFFYTLIEHIDEERRYEGLSSSSFPDEAGNIQQRGQVNENNYTDMRLSVVSLVYDDPNCEPDQNSYAMQAKSKQSLTARN